VSGVAERLTSNMEHTATPWYVTWFETYSEIHIQSAPLDEDNHVLSIHYGHSGNCPAHRDSGQTLLSCDPSICEGLREAMSNAKLIVESVNKATGCGELLINQHLFDEVGV
jgi:hypothetical protein